MNVYMLSEEQFVHKREVYNFLSVLGSVGGVKLILTLIFSKVMSYPNNKKSMISIIKKFFLIKTRDSTFLPEKVPALGENIYKLKFNKESGKAWILHFFSCFGYVPSFTKNHKRY